MPYITPYERQILDNTQVSKVYEYINYGGDLNYIISSIIWTYFESGPSYQRANTILGALEAAKQEFYRRKVAPYEDQKMKENGDL